MSLLNLLGMKKSEETLLVEATQILEENKSKSYKEIEKQSMKYYNTKLQNYIHN